MFGLKKMRFGRLQADCRLRMPTQTRFPLVCSRITFLVSSPGRRTCSGAGDLGLIGPLKVIWARFWATAGTLLLFGVSAARFFGLGDFEMAKPHRGHKKSNHGKRPANAKARRAKRRLVRT